MESAVARARTPSLLTNTGLDTPTTTPAFAVVDGGIATQTLYCSTQNPEGAKKLSYVVWITTATKSGALESTKLVAGAVALSHAAAPDASSAAVNNIRFNIRAA